MAFLILLLLWPLAEIALFIQIGSELGFLTTIVLCILAGIAGSYLVQWQGLKTTMGIRRSLNSREMPVQEIFDTFCIFLAGILFILPGFISDGVAALLLLPPFRVFLRRYFTGVTTNQPRPARAGDDNVIEGEFTRMDDTDKLN